MTLTPIAALNSARPALVFQGQGSDWQRALHDAASPTAHESLRSLLDAALSLTGPVARPLASAVPGAVDRLGALLGADEDVSPLPADAHPAVSVPGIVLAQLAAVQQLRDLGLALDTENVRLAGHSQGALGVAAVKHPEHALAFAMILGAAASSAYGARDAAPRMLSVRGIPVPALSVLLAEQDADKLLSVVNGPRHAVLAGEPAELDRAREAIEAHAAAFNAKLEAAEFGGSELNPVFDELPVAYPFHHASEANARAVELAAEWAEQCGLDLGEDSPRALAQAILVDHHDWPATVRGLLDGGTTHIVSLDSALSGMTSKLVAGSGVPVVTAENARARDALATPGTELPQAVSYAKFAPRLVRLPDGKVYTQTRFSQVTGLSPIILGGMTPTSADGEIVAAAANAGYWTELAGGGMYSEEVFNQHRDTLATHLAPGRTAQFNTMFFDRFLWNMHFGQTRMVPKARAAGAPFNGVCISAGIPEVEEATEIIEGLRNDGFPYIAFKPGTPAQVRDALAIASANPKVPVILMVEDGHAGGHHSWVDLDDMLVATYAQVREHDNAILTVGGGVYSPERAAELLTGAWAQRFDLPHMPVDAVFLGTVAMATKEAKATDSVKDLLVNTKGLSPADNGGWVARGAGRNGVASSQSHLLADIHDLDNSFAKASRLITNMPADEYPARREEIIAALAKTSKPFFGDIEDMTYAEWVERFVELAHPFVDASWDARFVSTLRRIEARLSPQDSGELVSQFADGPLDPHTALARLIEAYPQAREIHVSPRDAAWWISLHYEYPKPMPWVPAIDGDLKMWFGKDTLWQAQDPRYTADEVRIIPGPVAVAGITRKNEPVAELLGRFEAATTQALLDADVTPTDRFARLADATSVDDYLRAAPTLFWHGHLMDNPAYTMDASSFEIVHDFSGSDASDGADGLAIRIHTDSYWDDLPENQRPFYVREVTIPITLPEGVHTGASPVVDDARLPKAVFDLLAGLAGVGSVSEAGDTITELPSIIAGSADTAHPFGLARTSFHFPASLLQAHTAVTGAALGTDVPDGTPDALVGPCWPAIYTALGSATLADGYPVIEGLLNAVHLDHVIALEPGADLHALADGRELAVTSWCSGIEESVSGRIVTVELLIEDGERAVVKQMHRFAIRGRATTSTPPSTAPEFGGVEVAIEATPRSFVDRATVTAPADMTPFALVSGDYNPIHTSYNASGLVGLAAPLVHGMWLSATAQHLAGRHGRVSGWTYSMYGMVQLGDEVELTVERVGRAGIRPALEVTCRIAGEVVSRGQALLAQPATAYLYPGQGIQSEGMGAGDRAASPAAREIWRRADAHTRENLGFSIQRIVDANPTELTVRGEVFKHPEGVLHLTQFTQVALAVVAYAQTTRLRDAGALATGAMYAGHSLGEYTALASLGNIFDLESVIDVVYSRGSSMGSLVPRDAEGNSDYGMGALRPNMIGVSDAEVADYVAQVSDDTGEFLEIVNYNIKGQQYSVAGTKRGLAVLAERANAVRERAYVPVPGIDVPFHSRVLRSGVADFAAKLDELLPARIDVDALEHRYVPNLVARPFELTQDFIDAVRAEVPADDHASQAALAALDPATMDRSDLARVLLIQLLAWQFASPVRWIETQDLIFGRVEQAIEVGLASAPTLTNLAKREMAVTGHHIPVVNAEANWEQVTLSDTVAAPEPEVTEEDIAGVEAEARAETEAPAEPAPAAPAAPAAASAQPASDLPFHAADAINVLFAFQNKIRPEQITDTDTIEELTGGVSSRRNQLLMDMSAELGVPAIDGAAEADVVTLRERVNTAAPSYAPFGSVLTEAIGARLRQVLGSASLAPSHVADYVTGTWALPASWVPHVEAAVLLGTREEDSVRGGTLATLPQASSKAEVATLLDAAVELVAANHNQEVAKASAAASSGGGVVDSAALDAYREEVSDTLVATARTLLDKLGVESAAADTSADAEAAAEARTVLDTIEAELGTNWVSQVSPVFDARRAILFDDRWAQAREDLARIATGDTGADSDAARFAPERFTGTGQTIADQARWYAAHTEGAPRKVLEEIATNALATPQLEYADDVALVTGAAPGSIATALVERLLEGGATVIMTASRITQSRKEFARTLFRDHGTPGAALWLVPANLSSYRDVDALIDWIGTAQRETVGNEVKLIKPALVPTLAFPFAAPGVSGSLAEVGGNTETQARLLLWSLERTIAGLARLAQDADVPTRAHIVLPGSPNRGTFGGDGAYGEVKAALDAIVNKWNAETGWPDGVTLAQARIGWVAGTHLMGGNDVLIPAAREAGIHVWDPEEISAQLMGLASAESRKTAQEHPLDLDLTGGLADSGVSIAELAREASIEAAPAQVNNPDTDAPRIKALPNLANPAQPDGSVIGQLGEVTCPLDDMIVIAGIGEVSSWGSGRTRTEAEYGIQRDGTVELTAAGVLELAWMTGLVRWAEDPTPGWYDADGQEVAEEDIADRFRDEVIARAGVRRLSDKYFLTDGGSIDLTEVFLDRDVTFSVANEAEAREFAEADPDKTRITCTDGEWQVTRLAGATAQLPRKATLSRSVAGQMPEGFDPAKWGIPAQMVDNMDRIAVWNLVTAVDAFISAGFSPAELLRAIHPADVASTQGTGIGGMESLHQVFVSRFIGEERQSDILQEALPNVVAAHVMQSLVGGYGSMIHPVAACATAAVSVEEAVDKIKLGKADFVVAGGIDDVQVESLQGFGDMNATAETAKMTAQGIDDRFISRANDRRRGGFLEGEGGGTLLVVRGSLAAELGLPVHAVVAYADSFGDGAHTSIPAPGLGVLAAARGGEASRLTRSITSLGLSLDDVNVISKHDTSTNANDPNESELHSLLWPAAGRDPHAPMYVISQKSLTGHAKAGAALFQIGGLLEVLRTGRLPQNASLDCVDPLIAPKATNLVWLRDTLDLGEGAVKAAALTSLGFGHVGALVVLAHPGVFEAALAAEGRDVGAWRARATEHLRAGADRLEAGMVGRAALFEQVHNRRFADGHTHDSEIALLLDADARLGEDGVYPVAP